MDEPLYELRKDVQMPGAYWKAGIKKTEKEWREIFHMGESQYKWSSEWFLDLTPVKRPEHDRVKQIVEDIFIRENLFSISYKEAAIEAVHKALSELSNKQI